jgi:hypothetical protein
VFGNRLGWIISGAIVFAFTVLVFVVSDALQLTERTAFSSEEKLAALSIQLASRSKGQGDSSDGGELYLQALAAFNDSTSACEDFAQKPVDQSSAQSANPSPVAKLPKAFQLLRVAGQKSSAAIFSADPGRIINYQSDHPDLESLSQLGELANKAGLILLRIDNQPKEGRAFFLDANALGRAMYLERLNFDEYYKGLGLLTASLQCLAECEPEGSQQKKDFLWQIQILTNYDTEHVLPIYKVLASANQATIAQSAGDVFAFAMDSRERMFRVEAILKLGRYRFDALRNADQLGAGRTIARLVNDSDPVIKTAANAAQELTIEQYRMIH